jgi:thiamine biosynthesis lipoprotein
MAQNTMRARTTNVITVPTECLLEESLAPRIRRSSAARQCANVLAAAIAGVWLLCAAPASADWVGDAMDLMGTRVSVDLWADDEARGRELVAMVLEDYQRIDREMSTYKPDSEISRVNDHAAEMPVAVSDELFSLIKISLDLSAASHGAFDITYDSVGYLYDFREHKHPTDSQISEHLGAVDYRHVILDPNARTVRFTQPGVRINLGGIAKGYTVEHAGRLLREKGVEHALLNAGGDTRVIGDRRGKPWVIAMQHPRDSSKIVTKLPIEDEAFSTAGDYERFFEEDGHRYHHVINPSTGKPTEGILTVAVLGPDGTMTDGLDTAIFVLGVEKGLELIKHYPEYETIIVDSTGKVFYSDGLEPPEGK